MGISWQQLLIVLVIIILIFGTKKLKNIGSDLGSAVKGFKKAMGEEESTDKKSLEDKGQTIEGTAEKVDTVKQGENTPRS